MSLPRDDHDLVMALAIDSLCDPRTVRRWIADPRTVTASVRRLLILVAERQGLVSAVAERRAELQK